MEFSNGMFDVWGDGPLIDITGVLHSIVYNAMTQIELWGLLPPE